MNRYEQGTSPSMADWMMSAVKRNPEGLLLLAAGCALLMRTGRSGASTDWRDRQTAGWSGERHVGVEGSSRTDQSSVSEGMSRVTETASRYAADVADAASSYASSMSDYVGTAQRNLTEQSGRIAQQAHTSFQRALEHTLREQPLAVAIAGLAAGVAIAAVFPSSERERRALSGVGEKVSDMAEHVGQQLKDATAEAGERLKNAVDERGLSADGLKDVAKDMAGGFGSTFSESSAASGKQDKASKPASQSVGGAPDTLRARPSSSPSQQNVSSPSSGLADTTTSKPAGASAPDQNAKDDLGGIGSAGRSGQPSRGKR